MADVVEDPARTSGAGLAKVLDVRRRLITTSGLDIGGRTAETDSGRNVEIAWLLILIGGPV